MSSYAYFDGPRVFEVLAKRMDERPGLVARLLLNVERKHGDATKTDALVRKFAERLWTKEWPGTRRPSVYYDPRALDPDGSLGVLHAKAAVVDDEVAFVTSANLTEAALDRNVELGVLVRDRALAATITRHCQALIDRAVLHALPGA